MGIIKVANLIISNKQKEILLVKRASNERHPNLWSIPGGKKEEETLKECLKREIKEELGCLIKECSFFKSYKTKNGKKIYHANYFFGSIEGKIKLDKKELSEYNWFKKEKIPDNLAFEQNKVLADFLE